MEILFLIVALAIVGVILFLSDLYVRKINKSENRELYYENFWENRD